MQHNQTIKNNFFTLNKNYSTTRLLTKEQPITINTPEDKIESVLFLPKVEDRIDEGGLRIQGYFKKSYEDKPLISIVTVVYNGKDVLEETIKSVISQSYDNVEYIIIDGGSNDGTLDIIRKYEDYVDYWVSEKDKGIYDAMNKGSMLATGDYINFMNGGDRFYNTNVLLNISKYFINSKSVYFARAELNREDLTWLYPNKQWGVKNIKLWLKNSLPNHQAMFFPRDFYQNTQYNIKYTIGSDSDYKFKAQKECGFVFIDQIVCTFKLDGISSQLDSFKVLKNIMKDSWNISIRHRGVGYAIHRQIKILLKFSINKIVGESIMKKIYKNIKG